MPPIAAPRCGACGDAGDGARRQGRLLAGYWQTLRAGSGAQRADAWDPSLGTPRPTVQSTIKGRAWGPTNMGLVKPVELGGDNGGAAQPSNISPTPPCTRVTPKAVFILLHIISSCVVLTFLHHCHARGPSERAAPRAGTHRPCTLAPCHVASGRAHKSQTESKHSHTPIQNRKEVAWASEKTKKTN
jgi:hypothetical protein